MYCLEQVPGSACPSDVEELEYGISEDIGASVVMDEVWIVDLNATLCPLHDQMNDV